MSRAFIEEDDGDDSLPERPQPSGPNYVTVRGLDLLRKRVQALQARRSGLSKEEERDLRYWRARLGCAIVVDNSKNSSGDIRFGALVEVVDEKDGGRTIKTHPASILMLVRTGRLWKSGAGEGNRTLISTLAMSSGVFRAPDGKSAFALFLDDKTGCMELHGLTSVTARFHPELAEKWQKSLRWKYPEISSQGASSSPLAQSQ